MMAARMVRSGSLVCDIGTDHAYLPTYLILNGKIKSAIAADINAGPLSNAKLTLEKYGLTDKITLRLSNGLDKIEPNEAEDIVICGMGGNLIADILSAAPWVKNEKYRLVLQPQSHSEDVRKYLCDNGFEILYEDACVEHGKLYNCLCAEYKALEGAEYSKEYYYFGKLKMSKSSAAIKVIENVNRRLKIKEKYGMQNDLS